MNIEIRPDSSNPGDLVFFAGDEPVENIVVERAWHEPNDTIVVRAAITYRASSAKTARRASTARSTRKAETVSRSRGGQKSKNDDNNASTTESVPQ